MLLFIIASLAAALMTSAIAASGQSNRDRGVKRAVAAADAGLEAAIYRINKLTPGSLKCVVLGVAGQLVVEPVQVDGWCREQTENLGDGATYSYRVRAAVQLPVNGQQLSATKIVSTGTVNGVRRRVSTVIGSATGVSLFGDYAVISLDDLPLSNSARIEGNAGSNGDIDLFNSAQICGNATPGPGKEFTAANSAGLCPGFVAQPATEPFVLNPIDQGSTATVNDNSRIGVLDVLSKLLGVGWNLVTRALTLDLGSTLTLTGNVYSFCSLEINHNSELRIPPTRSHRPAEDLHRFARALPRRPQCRLGEAQERRQHREHEHRPDDRPALRGRQPSYPNERALREQLDTAVNILIYAPQSTVRSKMSRTSSALWRRRASSSATTPRSNGTSG